MTYKLSGRSGLRVPVLCLGTMTFGAEWGREADRGDNKEKFDGCIGAGGNFIDTANRYTVGVVEMVAGNFIASDPQRDISFGNANENIENHIKNNRWVYPAIKR